MKNPLTAAQKKKTWTFLDGPPFITGLPHYGSLLSSIPKDVFPRFWTMKGYRVRRVWGWDCHGLPAENKVENKLGITRKKDIEEAIGIKKFIDECKLYVKDVSGEWEWYVDHVGRWVDFQHAYKTMDNDYMETVMWIFKQMYDKKYIYKGMRVSLYCPHCSTPISNFEVAMDADNYKDVKDLGTTYKYKLAGQDDTYLLAWSTTPWNKIATPALAVNPELEYIKVQVSSNDEVGKEYYILAKTTLAVLDGTQYVAKETIKGKDLIGKSFEPHYDFYKSDVEKHKDNRAWIVVGGDFVTADEGTGIVTLAAYGEEDLKVMKENNIFAVLHVDEEGHIKKDVPLFGGMYYLKANKAVNDDLRARGLILKEEEYIHSMPHCWRCGTQLYYAPQDAWYVDIQQLKPKLFKNNEAVNWFPAHFKNGRFLKSMEAAPDWCISRSRYWGSPVPVWECECGERFVPGSIAELEAASGQKIEELHRPDIDNVIVRCAQCGAQARRVPEVLDSWIEAGSASLAERHFPFNTSFKLEDFFPPDFIVEYTGQIRAWFYVLHVIATALYDTNAFKNVAVTGVILGTDGRKMSKNFGNYPDPKMMITKFGGDALRLYLMGSPVMRGEDIIISEDEYRNQIKTFHIPLWNIVKFFDVYSEVDAISAADLQFKKPYTHVLDVWAQELTKQLVFEVTQALEAYNTVKAVDLLINYIDDISKWYIRRSRDRVGVSSNDHNDKLAFYSSLYSILTTAVTVAAPLAPFIADILYKHLTGEESVHLINWPTPQQTNSKILEKEVIVRQVVESGHRARKELNLSVQRPVISGITTIPTSTSFEPSDFDAHKEVVKAELNILGELTFKKSGSDFTTEYDITETEEITRERDIRQFVRLVQQERKRLGLQQGDLITIVAPEYPHDAEEYLKKKLSASSITIGEKLIIEKV
ncbi:MAG: Isoleucine--tRNA ligase 2 [Microgenomates bacterium OLB23]|nr:MAG: Isoleucine--tRNA ligase 2 [Microgenomates bacterium OLB23]